MDEGIRLQRLCRRMATAALLLAGSLLGLNLLLWLWAPIQASGLVFGLAAQATHWQPSLAALPLWQRATGLLISMLPLLALAYSLLQLFHLFRTYAVGDYFSAMAARLLGRAGKGILCWLVLDFIGQPLMSLAMTITNAPGSRLITVGIEMPYLVALLMAGAITVIAHVLARATVLADENSQFV